MTMQVIVPRNGLAMAAGQRVVNSTPTSAQFNVRTTTFECADFPGLLPAELLSEKSSSRTSFTPRTRELFGVESPNFNDFHPPLSARFSPAVPLFHAQRPATPDLVVDTSSIGFASSPQSPATPIRTPKSAKYNGGGFKTSSGKQFWPGMDDGDESGEESDQEYGPEVYEALQYGGESIRQTVPGYSGKSVRKTTQISESPPVSPFSNHGHGEQWEGEGSLESDDGRHDNDSGSEYEDDCEGDTDDDMESVKALPRGGKMITQPAGIYNEENDMQEAEDDDGNGGKSSGGGKGYPVRQSPVRTDSVFVTPSKPQGVSKNVYERGIPENIKAWIKKNTRAALTYVAVLQDERNRSPQTPVFAGSTFITYASKVFAPVIAPDSNLVTQPFGNFALAPTARSARDDQASDQTPTRKRKHNSDSTILQDFNHNFETSYPPLDIDNNADPNNTSLPTPFITPNLKLALSIDHASTNPNNTIRLHTPYPAPPTIITASCHKYLSNLSDANTKCTPSGSPCKIPFTIFEDDAIITHMLAIRNDGSIPATEERFAEVSRRLAKDPEMGVYRSKTAIKNMWCRVGRGRSGFDERKGVRRVVGHVVNGWKAKPGNEKPRKSKKARMNHGVDDDDYGFEEAQWFEL